MRKLPFPFHSETKHSNFNPLRLFLFIISLPPLISKSKTSFFRFPSMASAAAEADYKTVVLKVSIHCEGCKKKVLRILSKVQGIESIDIDIKQNIVTVKSPVDAQTLIQKLKKRGKHAELLLEVANPNVPAHVSSPPDAKETKEKPQKPTKIVVESSGSSPSTAAKKSPEAEKVEAVDNSVSEAKDEKMKKDKKSSETSKPAAAATDKSEKAPESREVEAPKKVDDNKAKSAVEFRGDHIPQQQVFPPQPAYIMSYNMTHPGMSQSHFVTPVAAASSQGYLYDDQYRYVPQYYDGLGEAHPDPTAYMHHQPAVDPYNIMFSDENPNASCSLM